MCFKPFVEVVGGYVIFTVKLEGFKFFCVDSTAYNVIRTWDYLSRFMRAQVNYIRVEVGHWSDQTFFVRDTNGLQRERYEYMLPLLPVQLLKAGMGVCRRLRSMDLG